MKHSSFRSRCSIALFAAAFAFSFVSHSVAEPAAALIMPKVSKSLLLDVKAIGGKLVAVGERGHVLLSHDNGKSWQQSPVPTAQALTAVYFLTDQQAWAAGHDGNIVYSEDGGETWVLQRNGLVAQAERNEYKLKEARANLQRLKRMADRGAEVDARGEDIAEQIDEAEYQVASAQRKMQEKAIAPPLMDIWFVDDKRGWAVGAFGTFLATADGGNTWDDISDEIADSIDGYHLNAVIGAPDGFLVIAGEGGYINVSHDFGDTWQQVDIDSESTVFGIAGSKDGSLIIATGLRGVTWRSEDKGETWVELNPAVDYSLSNVVLKGDTVLMVGAGGTIVLSQDKGDSFQRHILSNRSSLSQGALLDSGKILLVGQGGVHHFDPKVVDQK